MDAARVDAWLWAIRLFKTRSDATAACRGGHVRVNGRSVKPAQRVVVGDAVEARVHALTRIVEVRRVVDKRVGAAAAAECYVDHTPDVPVSEAQPTARRERGAGRPTKRDRRALDRLRGRAR